MTFLNVGKWVFWKSRSGALRLSPLCDKADRRSLDESTWHSFDGPKRLSALQIMWHSEATSVNVRGMLSPSVLMYVSLRKPPIRSSRRPPSWHLEGIVDYAPAEGVYRTNNPKIRLSQCDRETLDAAVMPGVRKMLAEAFEGE